MAVLSPHEQFLIGRLLGQAPYFLVLIVGFYLCLTHSHRVNRGLSLIVLGALLEIGVQLVSPALVEAARPWIWRATAAAPYDTLFVSAFLSLTASLLGLLPWCLVFSGALGMANEILDIESPPGASRSPSPSARRAAFRAESRGPYGSYLHELVLKMRKYRSAS